MYPAVRACVTAAGANAIATPVDDEGIAVDHAARCRLAFVTPAHQFPAGAILSAPRRRALLDWAARVGALIVEDDYDGDYRHAGTPTQALQGLAHAGSSMNDLTDDAMVDVPSGCAVLTGVRITIEPV